MSPKNLKIIAITIAVVVGLFLIIGLPILLTQTKNSTVVTTQPPTTTHGETTHGETTYYETTTPGSVDCEKCVIGFKDKGGCEGIIQGESELYRYIPEGCESCSYDDIIKSCTENNNQEPTTAIPTVYYKNTKIFSDDDCPNIGSFDSQSLDSCKKFCDADARCTGFNIQNDVEDGNKYCALRACNPPNKPPSWDYPGFVSYSKWQ